MHGESLAIKRKTEYTEHTGGFRQYMRKKERSMWGFIVSLIIGAVSGWIAGKIMKSEHNLIINLILGLVGGLVGGLIGGLLGFAATGWIARIIISVAGACILIWLYRKLFKK